MTIDKEDAIPKESDETLLSRFKSRLASEFVFVTIQPEMTSAELERSRPFLMKTIRMIASLQHRRFMWGQSHAVMRYISEAVIMKAERSLDLLQGILVFLSYHHYFCLAHGQFNNLLHLAMSMVCDMGLDRRTRTHNDTQNLSMDPKERRRITNEERRVLLGVWYMSSR